MNASELYKGAKLPEAIDAQIKDVKANPGDQAKRLFLFELLAFAGDLDRAAKQIEAINYTEMELEAATLGYRKLLDSERERRRLWSEGLTPHFFSPPPEHVHLRLEAVNRIRESRLAEAGTFLQQAAEACPALKGQLNDKPFDSLRDCDDLFAGVLEVIHQGAYYWVPLDQVEAIVIAPPKYPRDLLWIPARLEIKGDVAGNVFLAALYPNSHEHPDNQVKLGRMTDWKGPEDGPVLGVGLRILLAGDDEISILEWRQLQIES